jgi:3-phenylpropionate/trans-cinnamate dioxygenase ferredoxin reductase subunit
VLIGGGTGWAPIWTLAVAARREQRHRDLVVIAGSRDAHGLYMRRSLEWLMDDGVRDVIAVAENGALESVLTGRPTHYLPSLGPEDTVYVAGPPPLVDAVKLKSRAAAARCYADPFLPSAQPLSLIDRVLAMMRRPQAVPAPATVPMPSTAAARRTIETGPNVTRPATPVRRSQVRSRV